MCAPKSMRAVLAVALTMGAGYFFFREPAQAAVNTPTVSVEEVVQLIGASGVYIYDANSAKRYAAGHVPGAVHLPFDDVRAEKLPKAKDARIVFYCFNEMCTASHEAAKAASGLGYTNISLMRAGITGWIKAGQRIEGSPDA